MKYSFGWLRTRIKWMPYVVTAFHFVLIIICLGVGAATISKWNRNSPEFAVFLLAVSCGALGGAVASSRYVILAVRHRRYDPRRLLWQVMTPVYSATLSWIGLLAIKAGTLTVSKGQVGDGPESYPFIGSFAFLVGLASESFVKRLVLAAQALFGESNEEEFRQTKPNDPKPKRQQGEDKGTTL